MSFLRKDHKQRKIRCVSGRVGIAASVVSVVAGGGFTLTDNGAGRVIVTLSDPGRVFISAIASPIEATAATGFYCKCLSVSASAVEFGIYQADGVDGVLVDNVPFCFDIKVQDVRV